MINLDDEEVISLLGDLIGKNARNFFKRLVKNETKPDKLENRILCMCDFRTYIILIKNNKPNKIEAQFHLFDIKRLESLSKTQLFILTNDNRELKIAPYDTAAQSGEFVDSIYSEIEELNEPTSIDEIIGYYCSNLLNIFPAITIKDLIDTVNIQPEKRFQLIYNEIFEIKTLKKKLQICGCYSKSYSVHCNYLGINCFQEVVWDVNLIYGQNGLTEFSLNDFDYVMPRDSVPLISALKHNSWFEGFNSDAVKLTSEMQDELAKVFALPMCNIQNLSLVHTNLKAEFLQKILSSFQASKSFKQYSLIVSSMSGKPTNSFTSFKSINLSRNSIEDKGLNSLTNLFKEFPILFNLHTLILSRCSISSKSLNSFFSSIPDSNKLKILDLSFNNMKDEPTEFYKYLSEPNELTELNLSHTELDVDKVTTNEIETEFKNIFLKLLIYIKLFNNLSRGGCNQNLKKLNLSGNHTFSKINNPEFLGMFIRRVKTLANLDLSSTKLPGPILHMILANLKLNPDIPEGLYFNLSMNNLGSSLESFMYEFNNVDCLTSVDLSDNSLDSDSDILISQLHHTKIKNLSLSRNFHNSKSKVINKIILALTTWAVSKYTTLKKLWLVDCRLKSLLNDFINELGSFSHLRLLDISGNEIGDLGINYLSKSLQVNRSLQYLMFDRSNVSVLAYPNIIEAIKRNFTLKSIQIPVNDICSLYQKSPDKVNDIVKQMTELFSHRKLLLNAQNKCDLDQLFKTKMKLINEPFAATSSLNSHSIPRSPLHAATMTNSLRSNDADQNFANDSHAANKINTPQYIKEILQNLNESATEYLKEKPIEQQFAKHSSQILQKIDDVTKELEQELNKTLRTKYPNFASNKNLLTEKESANIVELKSLKNNINDYMNSMLVQIHNDICEMTYKMSATMAEKLINESQKNPSTIIFNSSSKTQSTYHSLSSNNTQTSVNKNLNSELETVLSNRHNEYIAPIYTTTTNSSVKKISNGIKCLPTLPKQPENNNLKSEDINVTNTEFRLTNNSKSKRPTSSQLNTDVISSSLTNNSTSNNEQPITPSRNRYGFNPIKKIAKTTDLHNKSISSSNENLCASDEDMTKESDPSSREKTPDSFQNELENLMSAKHKRELPPLPPVPQPDMKNDSVVTNPVADPPEIGFIKQFNNNRKPSDNVDTTPVPAPRKVTKPSLFGKVFPSRNNSPAAQKYTDSTSRTLNTTPASPNIAKRVLPVSDVTPDLKLDSIEDSEVTRLKHMNKSRPKRQNVRRPTKNAQTKADTDSAEVEVDDANLEVTPSSDSLKEAILEASIEEEAAEVKKPVSLVTPASSKIGDPQPLVSQQLLGEVKLRSTIKVKPEPPSIAEIESQPAAPIVTNTSNPNKLGNRFSMFEQPGTSNFSLHKPSFTKSKETSEATTVPLALSAIEESATNQDQSGLLASNKTAKPLPPVPPTKPPRPVFNANNLTNKINSTKDADTHQQPSILVKLRPVQTNSNGNLTQTTTSTTSIVSNSNKETNNSIFNTINNLNHNSGTSFVNNHKTNNLIVNENNCPVGVSLLLNNDENKKGTNTNNSVEKNRDDLPEKRTSVRELAQMMFEESKVGL